MKSLMKDIYLWINRISFKSKILDNYSVCPFAKSATYKIFEVNFKDINLDLIEYNCDVVIFVIKEKTSVGRLKSKCKILNKKYRNYIFLPDHKESKTFIKKISTGNGKHNIILCQDKKELNNARKVLTKTNYYKNWSKEYLKEIMGYGK